MSRAIDRDMRLLATIAYGEASTANDSEEIGGIAFAVANRCRAWGRKTVSELRTADPNYSYAWDGSNARFNKLMRTPDSEIALNPAMALAVDWARKALLDERPDPSNGHSGGMAWTSKPITAIIPRFVTGSNGARNQTTFSACRRSGVRSSFVGESVIRAPAKSLMVVNEGATTRYGCRRPRTVARCFGSTILTT